MCAASFGQAIDALPKISAAIISGTNTRMVATAVAVTVLDGADKTTTFSDYRWIIEEDLTFYVDPKATLS